MAWTGDISKMGKLAANVRRLAEVPSRVSARVAQDLAPLIQEEFDAGADPYGNSWSPLARATIDRGRRPPPLTDTEKMRRSVRVEPMQSAGVSITIDHLAQIHQTGWSGPRSSGPARPVLPSRTFPARWKETIDAAVHTEAQEVLR